MSSHSPASEPEGTVSGTVPEAPPRRTLGSGAALTFAGQFGGYAISVALGIAVARILGAEGTGEFNVVGSFVLILAGVATFGVGSGALYHVAQGSWPAADAVRQVQIAGLAQGLLFAAIGTVIALVLATGTFGRIPDAAILIGLAALPFSLCWILSSQISVAIDRHEAFALATSGNVALMLVLVLVLAPPFGLTGAVAAISGASLIVAGGFAVWVRRALPAPSPDWLRLTGAHLRAASHYGRRAYVPAVLQMVSGRLDLLILSALAAGVTVGTYSVALNVALIASQVPRALSLAVTARLASLGHPKAAGEARMVTVKAVRHGVLMTGAVCVAMAIGLPVIPLVYGHAFDAAVTPGFLLIPATAGTAIGMIAGGVLLGKGRPGDVLIAALVTTLLAVGLYVALIPPWEAIGAAIASSVSQVLGAVVAIVYLRRATPEIPGREYIPRRSDLRDYRELTARLRAALRAR